MCALLARWVFFYFLICYNLKIATSLVVIFVVVFVFFFNFLAPFLINIILKTLERRKEDIFLFEVAKLIAKILTIIHVRGNRDTVFKAEYIVKFFDLPIYDFCFRDENTFRKLRTNL